MSVTGVLVPGVEVVMWTVVVIAVLAIALVAWVWVRQSRHHVPPGKEPGADARREAHGSYWGGSAGGAF